MEARRGKYAARGQISRERLSELVASDLTLREIAAEVDRSLGTVRYWMTRYGLKTTQAARRFPPGAERPDRIRGRCRKHGEVEFVVRRPEGGYRCVRCRSEQVAAWRRRVKARIVAEAGGRCRLCGYDRSVAALHFHHLDPSQKRFAIANRGLARAIQELRAEASKCVLLCANCHAEVEAGVAKVESAA